MVVKIKPSCPLMAASLNYNENKVKRGEADILCCENMDTDKENSIRETFSRYERLNIRSKEVSFHMSINPGTRESFSKERIMSLTREIMDGLGYAGQPYVLYRHRDIEREHYHVLSIRVNEKGKKIRSFQEQNRCQRIIKELASKYGYTVGSQKSVKLTGEGINPKLFDRESGNVSAQLDAIFEECLKYHYTSNFQFENILADHAVHIKLRGMKLYLQGMDTDGRKCSVSVSKTDFLPRMIDRMQENLAADKSKAAAHTAGIAARLLPYSKSELHYVNMMLKKHIHVIFEKDGRGIIDRALFIDHGSKCAFYVNDFGHELSLAMIQDADKSQWARSEPQKTRINVGDILFAANSDSRSKEKDPKYKKKKKKIKHL